MLDGLHWKLLGYVDGILLRPPPFPDHERLVAIDTMQFPPLSTHQSTRRRLGHRNLLSQFLRLATSEPHLAIHRLLPRDRSSLRQSEWRRRTSHRLWTRFCEPLYNTWCRSRARTHIHRRGRTARPGTPTIFLIGIIGSKQDAREVMAHVSEFARPAEEGYPQFVAQDHNFCARSARSAAF